MRHPELFASGAGSLTPVDQNPVDRIPSEADFPPARVLHVELSELIPALDAFDEGTGRRYRQALVLARLHGRPVGLVTIDLAKGSLEPDTHAQTLWSAVGDRVRAHLQEDGLADGVDLALLDLDEWGLP